MLDGLDQAGDGDRDGGEENVDEADGGQFGEDNWGFKENFGFFFGSGAKMTAAPGKKFCIFFQMPGIADELKPIMEKMK